MFNKYVEAKMENKSIQQSKTHQIEQRPNEHRTSKQKTTRIEWKKHKAKYIFIDERKSFSFYREWEKN